MDEKVKAIRGVADILPAEISKWQFIENAARCLFDVYGYKEIRTPLLEETSLFSRSIGATTDIVQKQMYSFQDEKKRSFSLRPEATAPVVRAFLEHNLDKAGGLTRLYYMGAMFRAERPQAGRRRQFYQIGVEAIGSHSPYLDVEVIELLSGLLERLGLHSYTLEINTLGCSNDKKKFAEVLKKSIGAKVNALCADCKERMKRNVFRVLDCKNEDCIKIARTLAGSTDYICRECSRHFGNVKEGMDKLGIKYRINPHLVRGLDYYTGTVFELTHPALGAQNAIGAGGRYDNLTADLGGPKMGAAGFALGMERAVMALEEENPDFTKEARPLVHIAWLGEAAFDEAFILLNTLRRSGISAHMEYDKKSLKAQMRQAGRSNARYCAIIGDNELKSRAVILRDMDKSEQREIKIDKLAEEIRQ